MKYVCVSGGADSTAMALLLWERGENFEMVFADTGAELPENYWILPRLANRIDRKLNVVGNGGFFQHLNHYNWAIPGITMRWCTRILKQVPQDNYWKKVDPGSVAVGIGADEPRRLNYKGRNLTYPLNEAGADKKSVHHLCCKYNLLNPVYQWRTNVSCYCCFFQRKADWLGMLKHHPELYEISEEWERQSVYAAEKLRRVPFQWNQQFSLTQLRKADEAQVKLWPDPGEKPCLICSV